LYETLTNKEYNMIEIKEGQFLGPKIRKGNLTDRVLIESTDVKSLTEKTITSGLFQSIREAIPPSAQTDELTERLREVWGEHSQTETHLWNTEPEVATPYISTQGITLETLPRSVRYAPSQLHLIQETQHIRPPGVQYHTFTMGMNTNQNSPAATQLMNVAMEVVACNRNEITDDSAELTGRIIDLYRGRNLTPPLPHDFRAQFSHIYLERSELLNPDDRATIVYTVKLVEQDGFIVRENVVSDVNAFFYPVTMYSYGRLSDLANTWLSGNTNNLGFGEYIRQGYNSLVGVEPIHDHVKFQLLIRGL
jgi:hypothetical protein